MAKSSQKIQAISLRRKGESIKKIASILKVSVGSVSAWCRDIALNQEQIALLQKRSTDPYYGKKKNYLEIKKQEFDKKVISLKQKGISQIGRLSQREIFLIGIALYWAEGFKRDHQVGFATSDIEMAKFFIYWLNRCFNMSPQKDLIIRVTVNISHKDRVDEIQKYWSERLNVKSEQFSKPFFQKSVWNKVYENREEYHGVVRIKVRRSVDFLRTIYGYIEGLSLKYQT